MNAVYEGLVDLILGELSEVAQYDIKFALKEFKVEDKEIQLSVGNVQTVFNREETDENNYYLFKHTVNIITNMEDVRKHNKWFRESERVFDERFKEYIENMGIEYTDEVKFIITVMHELGHIKLAELYRRNGMAESLLHMIKMSRQQVLLAFGTPAVKRIRQTEDIDLRYHLDFNELNADNFVYVNFPRVWKQVKHEIEEMQTKRRRDFLDRMTQGYEKA